MNDQKWLNCRLSAIRQQLDARGHRVSKPVISRLLRAQGYSLRANRNQDAGKQQPERDRQFQHLQAARVAPQAAGQPVISVDTTKKELVGHFKNAGQIWCQTAEVVDAHACPQDAVGRAVPYGIDDRQHNRGTVDGGQSADPPAFAVDNIAHWCATELRERYPDARQVLIEADSGGSNSARSRVWKERRQAEVADRFGLTVTVCHDPSGASQGNPIEHRLFSESSKTWAGCPLRAFAEVCHYIEDTRTATGLRVTAHLVATVYAPGRKIADDVRATLNIQAHDVCPQWNYTIHPRLAPTPADHN